MALTPGLLTDSSYADILARGIKGGEIVEYSLYSNPSAANGQDQTLTIGYENSTINTYDHDTQHKIFIRSIFERLDPLLDLDFFEANSFGSSDINVYRAWSNSHGEGVNAGLTHGAYSGGSTHFNTDSVDISWTDIDSNDKFTDTEKDSIVHEIGHALGLKDLGFDPKWDNHDSVMSYNLHDGVLSKTWFTEADIKAMQSIWGAEDNVSPIPEEQVSIPPENESVVASGKTQVPVDRKWAKRLEKISGNDGIINFHIDAEGSYKKKSREFEVLHKDFVEDFLGEISEATGLKIKYVEQGQADILIHSTGGKQRVNRSKESFNVNLGKSVEQKLNDKSKQDIAEYILYPFGLDDIPKQVVHSGDDSLMSWHYAESGYSGLTSADITALQSIW